jgi:hypothetical protein
MPSQSGCKGCKRELVRVDYTCQHQVVRTGRRSERIDAEYQYKATWKCPAIGQTEVTDESATMEGLRCPTRGILCDISLIAGLSVEPHRMVTQ